MAKRPIQPEDLSRFKFTGDPQIHPEGTEVLFSQKTITDKNKYRTQLWSVDLGGNLKSWTQGEKSCSAGRWSKDGAWIYFISDREGPGPQVYAISTSGGEARRVTYVEEGSIGGYEVSPDGTKLALTYRPAIPERTEAAKKARDEAGLSEAPLAFDDIWYRLDGDGYFGNQRYALVVLDLAAALEGAKSEAELYRYQGDVNGNYDFAWSPDSRTLGVIHSASQKPAIDPPNDQIYLLDPKGNARQLSGLPMGNKSALKWSPDGKLLAYAGDVDLKDPWGVRNTKVYVVSAEGGEPSDLTGHQDYDMEVATLGDTREAAFGTVMEWATDGSGLYVQVGWHGEIQLGFVSLEGGVQLLTDGHHSIAVGNVSQDGTALAGLYGTATRLPEVAILERELATGRWVPRQLTALNLPIYEEIEIAEPKEFWTPTTDGLSVHGWVLEPVTGSSKNPAILQIHGGPHTQYGWTFFHELQVQAANGYTVVYSNPRGSKGYGEAWTSAIRGDWGRKDWEDIQAVTRYMKDHPAIDPNRMAVMGGSYGGYMTNWVIGHTDEFKCAISDRCVSNFVSMAGNSDFPFNKDGYFQGCAWGDLEDIKEMWRQSPISMFKNVKTPTLVIHSVGDLRCNIEQGEQVFTALQMQGVPSRMVRYPASTSHGLSRSGPPDLRVHRLGEILGWLDRFLKPAA